MTKMVNVLLLIALLLIASCASVLNGTKETIYLTSQVPGTKLYVNKTLVGTDEAKVSISKKRLHQTKLLAKKEGCSDTTVDIETRFDRTSLLGLLLDLGIVSILIVDWGIYGSVREAAKVNLVINPICGVPGSVGPGTL
jgi:hypothetical protein